MTAYDLLPTVVDRMIEEAPEFRDDYLKIKELISGEREKASRFVAAMMSVAAANVLLQGPTAIALFFETMKSVEPFVEAV